MEPKVVKIVHGSDTYKFPLVGYSIDEAIDVLDDEKFGGELAGLSYLLNGESDGVSDGTLLQEGDELKFMAKAGDKG
jgi:hypothetical protein